MKTDKIHLPDTGGYTMTLQPDKYSNDSLQHFVEMVLQQHYDTIGTLCVNATKQTEKVKKLETLQATSQYTTLCTKLITETDHYINTRKDKYIPYILQLSEKASTSHDCSNCSGSCKLNHDIQLVELKASNDMMKTMLSKLQIASLPLYAETLYPDEYRLLRNHMALLETNLSDLFYVENNYLIPKIQDAQKSINASNH